MRDLQENIAKSRTIALYAHMSSNNWYSVFEVNYVSRDEHYTPLPAGKVRELPYENYVRISEPFELRFTAIDNDTLIRNAMESLNAEERKAVAELNKKIADIRERKSQLLALSHSPTTEDQ